MILADQSMKSLSSHHRTVTASRDQLRWAEAEGEVWSLAVVVMDVFVKHRPKLMLAEDEQPIQRLMAESLDRSLTTGRWREESGRA